MNADLQSGTKSNSTVSDTPMYFMLTGKFTFPRLVNIFLCVLFFPCENKMKKAMLLIFFIKFDPFISKEADDIFTLG